MNTNENPAMNLRAAQEELENLKANISQGTTRRSPRNLPVKGVAKLAEERKSGRRALGEVVNSVLKKSIQPSAPKGLQPKESWGSQLKDEKKNFADVGSGILKRKKWASKLRIFKDSVKDVKETSKPKIEKISSDPKILGPYLESVNAKLILESNSIDDSKSENSEPQNEADIEDSPVFKLQADKKTEKHEETVDANLFDIKQKDKEDFQENNVVKLPDAEIDTKESHLIENSESCGVKQEPIDYPEVEKMPVRPSADFEDYANSEDPEDDHEYEHGDEVAGIEGFDPDPLWFDPEFEPFFDDDNDVEDVALPECNGQ